MAGYFKVSMDAAKRLAGEKDGDQLLMAWLVLCHYAYGPERDLTAAGAKSIRASLGISSHRSRILMARLLTLCDPATGEASLLAPTGGKKINAEERRILPWPGDYSYLPALLLQPDGEGGNLLQRLHCMRIPARRRVDALLVLLHVYAVVDVGNWFACPPDRFVHHLFQHEGFYEPAGLDVGCAGMEGQHTFWLVADTGETGGCGVGAWVEDLFQATAAVARFEQAFSVLNALQVMVPVIVVEDGPERYLLWICSPAMRQRLSEGHGIVTDLARLFQNEAARLGYDACGSVIQYAVEDCNGTGSGLYFCLGTSPVVRKLYLPRLLAPTPRNQDGLQDVRDVTQRIMDSLYMDVF